MCNLGPKVSLHQETEAGCRIPRFAGLAPFRTSVTCNTVLLILRKTVGSRSLMLRDISAFDCASIRYLWSNNRLLKNSCRRRVGARGLQILRKNRGPVGPVPSPGVFFNSL